MTQQGGAILTLLLTCSCFAAANSACTTMAEIAQVCIVDGSPCTSKLYSDSKYAPKDYWIANSLRMLGLYAAFRQVLNCTA